MCHPGFYCCQTGFVVGERGVVGGFGAEVNLCVVSVTVKVQVVVAENLTKGEDVDDKEEGAEY